MSGITLEEILYDITVYKNASHQGYGAHMKMLHLTKMADHWISFRRSHQDSELLLAVQITCDQDSELLLAVQKTCAPLALLARPALLSQMTFILAKHYDCIRQYHCCILHLHKVGPVPNPC